MDLSHSLRKLGLSSKSSDAPGSGTHASARASLVGSNRDNSSSNQLNSSGGKGERERSGSASARERDRDKDAAAETARILRREMVEDPEDAEGTTTVISGKTYKRLERVGRGSYAFVYKAL